MNKLILLRAGFAEVYASLKRKVSFSGKSESTLKNYALHLAHIALHFNQLPTQLDIDQINDYLYLSQQRHNSQIKKLDLTAWNRYAL